MKKYFITGLVILLPVALTFAILIFLFNLLTEPFLGIVQNIMSKSGILANGFLFLSPNQVQVIVSQILILCFLFGFTILLGFLASWFFINSLISVGDYIIHRIPLVNSIYKTCKDIINTLFGSSSSSFKKVVLVPFPQTGVWSMGFITSENLVGIISDSPESFVAVFMPTTPNPTSGFLMLFKMEELIPLDISVEDAFKYIISCGVIQPKEGKEPVIGMAVQ